MVVLGKRLSLSSLSPQSDVREMHSHYWPTICYRWGFLLLTPARDTCPERETLEYQLH